MILHRKHKKNGALKLRFFYSNYQQGLLKHPGMAVRRRIYNSYKVVAAH
jgi:hypothetical protein